MPEQSKYTFSTNPGKVLYEVEEQKRGAWRSTSVPHYPFGPFQRAGSDAKTQAQDTTMLAGGRAGCESLVIISEERVDEDKDNRIVAAVA